MILDVDKDKIPGLILIQKNMPEFDMSTKTLCATATHSTTDCSFVETCRHVCLLCVSPTEGTGVLVSGPLFRLLLNGSCHLAFMEPSRHRGRRDGILA
jgi:hypothetical protein